ncbi:MAG: hypothetical protein IT483_07015 [Gammaproteobacteria bacterium]|nr:hypothetical protein [Gammaproteobacteria bacterium]
MTPLVRGLLIGAVQVALVAGVGGQLLYDRATLPRAWAETVAVDPTLPIRGRYVELRLAIKVDGDAALAQGRPGHREAWVRLYAGEDRLAGRLQQPYADVPGVFRISELTTTSGPRWVLDPPVLYFIPEHAIDPSRPLPEGQELWAEVSVPHKGPPRPIRLGIRREGRVEPLEGLD